MKLTKRRTIIWLCLILCILLSFTTGALALDSRSPAGISEIDLPSTTLSGAAAYDITAQTLIFEKDMDRVFSPVGSAVTLMSAYVASSVLDFSAEITITQSVASLSGGVRTIGLKPGDSWTVADLTAAMLLYGAQDAALALSEAAAESTEAFVQMMNVQAQTLGLNNTHYTSPLGGQNEQQATSTADQLLLALAVLENETLRSMLTTRAYKPAGDRDEIVNRMEIMHEASTSYDARVYGLGTGSTSKSGTNLIVFAQANNRELLLICEMRQDDPIACEQEASLLLDYCFDNFQVADCINIASALVEEQTFAFGDELVLGCTVQETSLPVLVTQAVSQQLEQGMQAFSMQIDPLTITGELTEGVHIANGTLLLNGQPAATLTLLADAIEAPINPAEDLSNPEDAASLGDQWDIPIYTAEDWAPANESTLSRYGWLISIIGVCAIFAGVLLLAHWLKNRVR